jgi:hypothetical protein
LDGEERRGESMDDHEPLHCEVVENGERCQRKAEREWGEPRPDGMTYRKRSLCDSHWWKAVNGEKLFNQPA